VERQLAVIREEIFIAILYWDWYASWVLVSNFWNYVPSVHQFQFTSGLCQAILQCCILGIFRFSPHLSPLGLNAAVICFYSYIHVRSCGHWSALSSPARLQITGCQFEWRLDSIHAVSADTVLYYIDTSVLLENTPLVKFIGNHIRDSSGVFSVSSLVKISMISLVSSLSLKLYLHCKFICVESKHRRVFLESLRQSSEIFVFVWPADKFWRIFGNLRKVVGNLQKIVKNSVINVYIRKRTLHVSSEILIGCFYIRGRIIIPEG